MKNLSLNQMENVSGGEDGIPAGICAAAAVISCFGLVGLAIGGPISLGCLLKGNSFF
jgi:hypothetical protein